MTSHQWDSELPPTAARLAHLINPLVAPKGSDLVIAQPITFEAMRSAKAFASGRVAVELLAAAFAEDAAGIPHDFTHTTDLETSVLDRAAFRVQRKLPLIRDLLARAHDHTDAEYVIYTNVDITPLPHFYLAIAAWLHEGYDALVINRRTVGDNWTQTSELPLIWAETGIPHPGFDCFVFPREWIPDLDVGDVCIGVYRIGLVLLAAIHHRARRFKLIEDAHLTCHIGDDRGWRNPALTDYYECNTAEAKAVFERIADQDPDFCNKLPSWAGPAA